MSKFQALKLFGTKVAFKLEKQVNLSGRKFKSNLTILPHIDWKKEVDKLEVTEEMKVKIWEKLMKYVAQMEKNMKLNKNSNLL